MSLSWGLMDVLSYIHTCTEYGKGARVKVESGAVCEAQGDGQLTCTPLRPKCGECAASHLCPSAFAETVPKNPTPKNIKAQSPPKTLLLGNGK